MGVYKALGKAAIEGGQQFLKRMGKAKTLPKLAPQITDTLSKHIDITKGADIPELETMLKGVTAGDESAIESFNGFTKTLLASDKYQANVAEQTRAVRGYTRPDAVQTDTSGIAGRGEPFRAHKATSREGAKSIIAGTPNTIISKEPQNTEKAMSWAKGAYEYARSGQSKNKAQPLKGYPRYVGEDGTLYKPKPNVGAKGGYQLKFVSMDLLKGYDDLRRMREAPWRKQDVIDQLQTALNNQGKGDKLDKLLKIMLKDYNTKLKGIKAAGQTKGHFVSLDKGGLDVAENFGPQKGKSTKNPKTGKWEMGNYAEKADSSIPEGTNVPTTWEEYVALKLPLLK
jgi:hypothetical protein